jgi:hypothetical protein
LFQEDQSPNSPIVYPTDAQPIPRRKYSPGPKSGPEGALTPQKQILARLFYLLIVRSYFPPDTKLRKRVLSEKDK